MKSHFRKLIIYRVSQIITLVFLYVLMLTKIALAQPAGFIPYTGTPPKPVTSANPLPVNATVTATATTTATASSTPTSVSAGPNAPLNIDLHSAMFVQPTFAGTPVDGTHGLPINCISGCSGGAADESAFTAGATSVFTGGFFQTTATSNPLTNGQIGVVQMTANRAFMVNLRNASGAELGLSAAPLQVGLASGNVASGAYASGAFAAGSGTDGWNITEGAKADAAWVSGSGSLVAIAKTIAGNTEAASSTPAAATASAIVTGGTAVTLVTGPVHGCYVTNPLTATDQNIASAEVAYVNPVTTATANGSGTNSALQPGQTFSCPPGMTTNLSAIAATSSHAFNVVKW